MAEDPLAALLEVARGLTILSGQFLSARRLFAVTLTADLRLADLTAPGAYCFGITSELAAAHCALDLESGGGAEVAGNSAAGGLV